MLHKYYIFIFLVKKELFRIYNFKSTEQQLIQSIDKTYTILRVCFSFQK